MGWHQDYIDCPNCGEECTKEDSMIFCMSRNTPGEGFQLACAKCGYICIGDDLTQNVKSELIDMELARQIVDGENDCYNIEDKLIKLSDDDEFLRSLKSITKSETIKKLLLIERKLNSGKQYVHYDNFGEISIYEKGKDHEESDLILGGGYIPLNDILVEMGIVEDR